MFQSRVELTRMKDGAEVVDGFPANLQALTFIIQRIVPPFENPEMISTVLPDGRCGWIEREKADLFLAEIPGAMVIR